MFMGGLKKKMTVALGDHIELTKKWNINTASGGGIYINGSVLAAAELTYIDGITAIGTAQASKAVVLDTSKGIVGLGVTSVGTSNTSGVVLTESVTNALQVVAEDNGVTIASGNAKAIKGRLYIKANPGDCTLEGILGQIKFNTDITASADYQSGVRGYLELVGGNTVNTGGANANAGSGGYGLRGYITADDNLTISANHHLVGCGVQLSVKGTKSITTTGTLSGFATFADDQAGGATATQKWQYGLYMPTGTVLTAINIGNCDYGINFSGTVSQGTAGYAFAYGTIGATKSITPTDSIVPMQISVTSIADHGTAGNETIGAAYFKTAATTAAQTGHQLATLMVRTSLGHNVFDAYGMQSHLTVAASMATANDNAHLAASSSKITFTGTPTVSKGWLSAGLFIVEGTGTVTQICHGIDVVVEAGSTGCTALAYLDADAAVTNGIEFVNANLTNAFKFSAASGCIGSTELTDNASSDVNCDKHMVIDVAGTPYYIPLYDTKK